MKIIRFDSVGGASGDMILGALIGLGVSKDELNKELAPLIPEHFHIVTDTKSSYGINAGIQAKVDIHEHAHHHHGHDHEHKHAPEEEHSQPHDHEHSHSHGHHHHEHSHGRNYKDIERLISVSKLPDEVKDMSLKVFYALAEAEGKVHGKPVEEVHFHEVGAVDSIVDIVGCCLAFYKLKVDAISVSPLPTGSGTFECQHGTYPLPAPATLEMLKRGLQTAPTDEPFEMVTPTGAALLAIWPKADITSGSKAVNSADSFGQREMKNRPNLLRATLYDTEQISCQPDSSAIILEANIDDCSSEIIGYTFDRLLESGALDVWITPVHMKKNRCGMLLSVICEPSNKEKLLEIVLTETSTLGVREQLVKRHCLKRRFEKRETPFGEVKVKIGTLNGKDVTVSPEFSNCAKLAREHDVPLKDVINAAR
ncbi:MAG: nickel pincer cofactor biosynthesis protein LarC [Lentisphaerae bacterium]|nr:nickel pincer cofactor biosynthesis protein LarC [Lentisphaerota bacterium]MCP4100405.1 nickel pincer cofactor biosynthesis protein LarC [Lentisphaerota bacterium]